MKVTKQLKAVTEKLSKFRKWCRKLPKVNKVEKYFFKQDFKKFQKVKKS